MLIVPVVILFVFIGGIIGIVNWQKSQQSNSAISVNIPEGAVQTTEKQTIVSGNVPAGSKVTVNGQETKVGEDGSYSATVSLNKGDNKIEIKSEKDGKVSNITRSIKLIAGSTNTAAPTTTSAPSGSQTPQAGSQPAQAPVSGSAATPSTTSAAPQAAGTSNLSTSGPADMILPVAGFAGIIVVAGYYLRSRKKLLSSMKK